MFSIKKNVSACKTALKLRENRLITGLLMLGAGVGIGGSLIVSAYIKLPE